MSSYERLRFDFVASPDMKGKDQLPLLASIAFLLLSTDLVRAGELSPGRFTRSWYELFDDNPMTYYAARAACEFNGGQLDLAVPTAADIHYRVNFSSLVDTDQLWAPMQKQAKDEWRWLNGSKVDVSDDDKERLRTHEVTTERTCATWSMSNGYVPESCKDPHDFLCLMATGEECHLKKLRQQKYYGIDWNQEGYPVYESIEDVTAHFQNNPSSPAVYRVKARRVGCRRRCDDFHFNESLPMGCWFVRRLANWCTLLLAHSFPDRLFPVVPMNSSVLAFRTCLKLTTYKNDSCPLECSCRDPDAPATLAEALAQDKKIKSQLTLPTTNLSATVRRKTSAEDGRPSAKAVGIVGVSVISSLLILVVILDMTSLARDVRMLVANVRVFTDREPSK